MITFKNFCEKIFDGRFERKTEQDEAFEFLQSIGKFVDSRKVREDRMTLRNNIFVLFKRPMTAIGTGFLIGKVIDDGMNGMVDDKGSVQVKIVSKFGGNDFSIGSTYDIKTFDALAVSQDNKRFYIVKPHRRQLIKNPMMWSIRLMMLRMM